MKKIVFGIVIMAVLLGGLGAGFAAGYEYKCMEEEQLFDELFMEMNEEWGCSCYYTGDMRRGLESIEACVEDDLIAQIEEIHTSEMEALYEKESGVLYCDGERLTCEEIEKDVNCAACDIFGSYGGWKLYETEEARTGFAEWFCNDKYGKQTYVKTMSPEDYRELKTFCDNWGEGVCEVCDDVAYTGSE
ncbi:MAG: hypothetical protein WA977_09880 [Halobacteriota archaeon]